MIYLGALKFSLAEIQDTPEAAKHLDAFMGASHNNPNWQHIKTSNGYWAYTDNKDYTTYIAFSISKHVYDNFTLLGKHDVRYYPEHINTTYGSESLSTGYYIYIRVIGTNGKYVASKDIDLISAFYTDMKTYLDDVFSVRFRDACKQLYKHEDKLNLREFSMLVRLLLTYINDKQVSSNIHPTHAVMQYQDKEITM